MNVNKLTFVLYSKSQVFTTQFCCRQNFLRYFREVKTLQNVTKNL